MAERRPSPHIYYSSNVVSEIYVNGGGKSPRTRVGLSLLLLCFLLSAALFSLIMMRIEQHSRSAKRAIERSILEKVEPPQASTPAIPKPEGKRKEDFYGDAGCMRLKCVTKTAECSSSGPTGYLNYPNPPCCAHILRDMLQEYVIYILSINAHFEI